MWRPNTAAGRPLHPFVDPNSAIELTEISPKIRLNNGLLPFITPNLIDDLIN
jgi:hypothetical protein